VEPIKMLSTRECAQLMGIACKTWTKLAADGKAPAGQKIGRQVRWVESDVIGWLRAGSPNLAYMRHAAPVGAFMG